MRIDRASGGRAGSIGIACLLAAAACCWAGAAVAAGDRGAALVNPRDRLEGTWKVTVTPESGKAYDDVVTFKSGKISSKKLKADGFADAEYESDTRGGQAVTFTATQKGRGKRQAQWTGTAAISGLDGTLKVTADDGSETTCTFKGERQEK